MNDPSSRSATPDTATPIADRELLRRYAAGRDDGAFAELVQRHLALVYGAALRQLGGAVHRAEEVTQSVFTDLARKASSLAGRDDLTGWLYTSTHFAAAKLKRAEQRRQSREQEAHTMHELLSGSPSDADWERLRPVLDDAMHELGERERDVILQRFFQGRRLAEVGEKFGLSEDAARMRVDRALEKLRAFLARRGVTSTAAALGTALANQPIVATPAHLAATVAASAVAGASVGGGAAMAGGALTLMSTSKIIVGVAAVIAAVGIGSAVYQASNAEQAAAELTALRQERDAANTASAGLQARLQAAESKTNEASAQVAALQKELAKKSADVADARAASAKANPVANVWGKPDYARMEVEKFRAALGLRYGAFYRAHNLSEAQIAKFEAAMTEAHQGVIDIWAAANSQGIEPGGDSPTSTSLARMTSDPLKTAEENVKALLGEDGFKDYEQFNKTEPAREFAATVAGKVYGTETPLTSPQGETLTQILATNTKMVKTRMADDGNQPLYQLVEVTDWDAVNSQARAVLSPSQLKVLRALGEQTKLDRDMQQVLNPLAAANGK